jgi:hypothetical protein
MFKIFENIIYINKIEINISSLLVEKYKLPSKPISPLNRTNHNVKLAKEKYFERYRDVLNAASSSDQVPPHWAYVTDSGIIEYEKTIRNKPEYVEDSLESELDELTSKMSHAVPSMNIAFMVYGFGNAVREQVVIDKFCEYKFGKSTFINPIRVIFIDISPYYCSQFYWARRLYHSNISYKESVYLIDFIEDVDQIVQLRKSLKNKQVIHLFMGNIAGNYGEKELQNICEAYTHHGDFLLMEYGLYNFNNAIPSDYQHTFACEALKEMYAKSNLSDNDIILDEVIDKKRMARYINIKFQDQGKTREFKSFLRRNFNPAEFASGEFKHNEMEVDSGKTPCRDGVRKFSLFQRLSE